MTNTIRNNYFYQINRTVPCSDTVIHIFDVDDTLTLKPEGFDNSRLSKDEFFDASREFGADHDTSPTKAASQLRRCYCRLHLPSCPKIETDVLMA